MPISTFIILCDLMSEAHAQDGCTPDYESATYEDRTCRLFGTEVFCAEVYGGNCPTFEEQTSEFNYDDESIRSCGPGSDVATVIESETHEGSSAQYFDEAGAMVGGYSHSFNSSVCCEGEWANTILYGIEPPTCTPEPEEEPKDSRWSCASVQPQTPGLLLLGAALLAGRRRRR
jgi:MYXO-CTERM domain-containing protein